MKHLLSKNSLYHICENLKICIDDIIYIHHPITEDLIQVQIKKLLKDKVLVTIPNNSPYLGQPDWYISKINIISTVVKQKL